MAELDGETLMRYEVTGKPDSEETENLDAEGKPKKYGWRQVAIVKKPAVVIKGMAFSTEIEEATMAFADDVKMRIAAPVSIAMEIPRKAIKAENGEEEFNQGKPFVAEFTEPNIEEMFVAFMSDPENLKGMFNYEHNPEATVPAFLLEIWLVENPLKDRSFSTFGVRVPRGTVFAVAQFTDRDYYNKLVGEGCTGFSVEGRFGLELKLAEESVIQNYADVIVLDDEKRVLMLKRKEDDEFEPGVWGLPGGKIEPNESAQEGAARELMEETGLTYSEIIPVDVRDNEDGSNTSYFTVNFSDYDGELILSDEHEESNFFTVEELKELPVIMGQNERFIQLVQESINKSKNETYEKMKEGQEFEIDGVMYIVKDGVPVKKETEAAVAAADETAEAEKDKEKEKPTDGEAAVAAADETTPAATPGAMDEASMVALIQKTVAPMITDAMAAVVDEVSKKEADETAEAAKEADMAYSIEGNGGKGNFMDFLSQPSVTR